MQGQSFVVRSVVIVRFPLDVGFCPESIHHNLLGRISTHFPVFDVCAVSSFIRQCWCDFISGSDDVKPSSG